MSVARTTRTVSPFAKGLAVLFSGLNGLAILLELISLAAFLVGYDAEDPDGKYVILGLTAGLILLIVVTTVVGWRLLPRRPIGGLVTLGAPGGLLLILMVTTFIGVTIKIDRMQQDMGWTQPLPLRKNP
jgi:hypothetical protein